MKKISNGILAIVMVILFSSTSVTALADIYDYIEIEEEYPTAQEDELLAGEEAIEEAEDIEEQKTSEKYADAIESNENEVEIFAEAAEFMPLNMVMVDTWDTLRTAVLSALAGDEVTIELENDITLPAGAAGNAIIIPAGLSVTLNGNGHTLTRAAAGQRHFVVHGTLRLYDVILSGSYPAVTGNHGGVQVNAEGHLIMGNGSAIRNNRNALGSQGGGVTVTGAGAVFTMDGGEISGNSAFTATASSGFVGGVFVQNGARFIMDGGVIHHNEGRLGGGVAINAAAAFGLGDTQFIMTGGEIRSNKSTLGGGVNVERGTFTMAGGTIHNNTATALGNPPSTILQANRGGGGVFLQNAGRFYMEGGTIRNNYSGNHGGGVMLLAGTAFDMISGTISDNTAETGDGGGVFATPTSTTDPIAANAYQNIIAAEGVFYGNAAGGGRFAIPSNAYTRSFGQLLNNYNINYRGTYQVYETDYPEIDDDIPDIEDEVPEIESNPAANCGSGSGAGQRRPRNETRPQGREGHPRETENQPPGGGWSQRPYYSSNDGRRADASRHYAFMVGFEDGTIRPEATTNRAEVAAMFFNLMSNEERAAFSQYDNPFPDVKQTSWYNNAVSATSNYGLFSGMPDGTFQPQRAITRAELTVVLANLKGETYGGVPLFNDIAEHWAQGHINMAVRNGWVNGFDGTFLPDKPVTRAEAASIINHVFNRLPESRHDLLPDMRIWPDNTNPEDWFYIHIQEATNSHYYTRRMDDIHEIWVRMIR
ncbi:MAG: S-layer homology domain-containing protein [Defluviitaleaceae bacterium]|nr:S-layer homology domain-containing protein [Defluviitaleaceae bacterium]